MNIEEIDLNDLRLFAQVAEAGGFSAAERQSGTAKATLSRRIARLEEELGLCLIQRDARRFHITETGQMVYRYAAAITAEANAVREMVAGCHAKPQGTLRISCPPELLEIAVNPVLIKVMRDYPEVRIHAESTAREVDILEEGIDIALRVRSWPLPDSPLIAKPLSPAHRILTAASSFSLANIEDLSKLPCLSSGEQHWQLNNHHQTHHHSFQPVLQSGNLRLIHDAAIAGLGIAALPQIIAAQAIAEGKLYRVLPEWQFPEERIIAVYPSRRYLVPAVRLLLDYLAEAFSQQNPLRF